MPGVRWGWVGAGSRLTVAGDPVLEQELEGAGAAFAGEIGAADEGDGDGLLVGEGGVVEVGAVAGEGEDGVEVGVEHVGDAIAGFGGRAAGAGDPAGDGGVGGIQAAGEIGHRPVAAGELGVDPGAEWCGIP